MSIAHSLFFSFDQCGYHLIHPQLKEETGIKSNSWSSWAFFWRCATEFKKIHIILLKESCTNWEGDSFKLTSIDKGCHFWKVDLHTIYNTTYKHTCFAKKMWSSLESWTIDPAGSSPGCHLKRKINPWTGLEQKRFIINPLFKKE